MWTWVFLVVGTLKFSTTSGDLTVRIVPDSLVPQNVVSKSVFSKDLVVTVGGEEALRLETVSGNIEVENLRNQPPFPPDLYAKTVSGDLKFDSVFPSRIQIETVSGDVEIFGSRGDGEGTLRVQTISGDIEIELPPFPVRLRTYSGALCVHIPEKSLAAHVTDTLTTFSGDLSVSWDDEKIEPEGDTVLIVGSRTLVITSSSWKWKQEQEGATKRQQDPNLYLFQPHPVESPWGDVGKIPGFALDYNRVDGFKLITHAFHFDMSQSQDERGVFTRADLMVSWSFGRQLEGVRSPWHRMGMSGAFELGGFLGPDKKEGIWASFLAEYWNSETSTHDYWRVPDDENTLAAFFFKRDFYDYFLMDGYGVGARFGLKRTLQFQVGYRSYTFRSLPVTQRFSVFHNNDPFRENPSVEIAQTQGVEILGAWHFPALEGGFRAYLSQDTLNVRYAMAYLRLQYDTELGNLRSRVVWGRTNAPAPFAFALGGVGTLPAFPDRSISTDHFLLWNSDYLFPGGLWSAILFWDVLRVPGLRLYADAGVGLAINGLSLRIARKLAEDGSPVIYLRFKERF